MKGRVVSFVMHMGRNAIRVAGVASLAFRAALRTRAVGALFGLLALVVISLPAVVRGDGTPAGQLNILLTYTLGLAFAILCLATLWAACALFAAEIDSSRMELTVVKPVTPGQQTLGKWLALLALDVLMLLLVYAGVYGQIRWRMHYGNWAEADRPSSRFVSYPLLPSPLEEARVVYAEMEASGKLPRNISRKRVLQTLVQKAEDRYTVINPGEETTWSFRLRHPAKPGEPMVVRIRFDSEFSTRRAISGECALRCTDPGAREEEIAVPLRDFTQSAIEFQVKSSSFQKDPADASVLRNFTLTFRHLGSKRMSSALLLRFRKDVSLLTPGGSFEANLARSAFVHGCLLAVLAAMGLALSACFSLPVAAFAATLLLILFPISHSVVLVISEEDRDTWQNRTGIWISEQVHDAVRHAVRTNPLSALTAGQRMEDDFLAKTAGWDLVLLPLTFGLLGCAALRRRELSEK